MRFLIFIYGKSRMKRTQLVSDKRAECHILLPKDDFSLERTVFLQFKNISGEWFIKETDCCHIYSLYDIGMTGAYIRNINLEIVG